MMRSSDKIDQISKALAAAQLELENVAKNSINPHYRSRYADLAAVVEAVRPVLNKHGIVLLQPLDIGDHGNVLETRLIHESGQWIASCCLLPTTIKMQEFGSAVTYARRYSLLAMVGIASEDDDAVAADRISNGSGAKAVTEEADARTLTMDEAAKAEAIIAKMQECGTRIALADYVHSVRPLVEKFQPAIRASLTRAKNTRLRYFEELDKEAVS